MIEEFIKGLLLGWGAAVPIGPVNIIIISLALRSYLRALCFGLGAMSADIFYLVLLSFGVLTFLDNPTANLILTIFGFCFLSYIAWGLFKSAEHAMDATAGDAAPEHPLKSYAKGFGMTITNPYTIGFWLSIATTMRGGTHPGLVVAGLIIAIFSWISLMPLAVSRSKRFFSPRVSRALAYICALIIFGFAIAMVVRYFW